MFYRIGEVNRICAFKKGMPCQDLANNRLNKTAAFIAGLFRKPLIISINLQDGNWMNSVPKLI